MSHTYALLKVSSTTYEEIKKLLVEADYLHAVNKDGEIDMHGIALVTEETLNHTYIGQV